MRCIHPISSRLSFPIIGDHHLVSSDTIGSLADKAKLRTRKFDGGTSSTRLINDSTLSAWKIFVSFLSPVTELITKLHSYFNCHLLRTDDI